MSLPPGFLEELKTRVSLAEIAGRKVIWDNRKSNQAKGDMWAPCPFHQEKTASFHVDDRKGFYYCFGCHAKGDLLAFVQETDNIGFMEAVEMLAGVAGMPMPAPDPKAREKAEARTKLADVTEAALTYYRLQLKTAAAAEARAYLDRRGLSAETIDRFEIGFASPAQQGAFKALTDKGLPADAVIASGVASKPDDGGAPYDAFRNRIMFPIRNPRGVVIGFGGRAMDPNARAKYLNTRETPLFDKGRALYNHGPAREAAGKGQTLIVAEGYMDVIALVEAGFEASVAPLGTAITPDQLALLWQIADEPVIALDGDTAGLRAAMRLIDLALPLLKPGKSLRFALMPPGQDPDDLIRAGGPAAMAKIIDGAQPMIDLLWRRETEGRTFDSPERRAALDAALGRAISVITDSNLRHHYDRELKDRRWQFFRNTSRPNRRAAPEVAPRPETAGSPLVAGSAGDLRAPLILAILAHHPGLIDRFETDLDKLEPGQPDLARLARHLLGTAARDRAALHAELERENLLETLEKLMALGHVRLQRWIPAEDASETARACLAEEFAKLAARRGIDHELAEGLEDLGDTDAPAHLSWRINHAVQTRLRAERAGVERDSETAPDLDRERELFLRVIKNAGKKENRH
ncbi:DNA primase [Rhodobacterales bacterium HKCCE3408]|nr:DNA primase [Rhodobacterales bacterium HKCCE3408]